MPKYLELNNTYSIKVQHFQELLVLFYYYFISHSFFKKANSFGFVAKKDFTAYQ